MLASLQSLFIPCACAAGDVATIAKRFEAIGFTKASELDSADPSFLDDDTTLDGRLRHLARLFIGAATVEGARCLVMFQRLAS